MNDSTKQQEDRFFFNGVELSKYGSWWSMVDLNDLGNQTLPFPVVSIADVWDIRCRIDHFGIIESSEPDIFIFAVQETLLSALEENAKVVANFKQVLGDEEGTKAYAEFLKALLRMRGLTQEFKVAFWTSDVSSDTQDKIKEAIRKSKLDPQNPQFELPPHIRKRQRFAAGVTRDQVKKLHSISRRTHFDKWIRQELAQIK